MRGGDERAGKGGRGTAAPPGERRGAGMCAVPARLQLPQRARTPTAGLHFCSQAVRVDARPPARGSAPLVLHLPREWAHKQRPPWMRISPPGCRTAPEVCVSSRGCAATPRGCRLDPRPVHSGCSSTVARLFPGCDSSCRHLFPLHPHPRALSTSRPFGFSPGMFELQVPQRKAPLRPHRGASGGLQGFGSTVLLCKAINRRAEGRETGHCWERSPVRRCQAVPCTTPPTMQAKHCTVHTVSSPQPCSAQRSKWGHGGTLGKSCWKSPCTAPWSVSW